MEVVSKVTTTLRMSILSGQMISASLEMQMQAIGEPKTMDGKTSPTRNTAVITFLTES
ncbi:hypothetical protein WN944_013415 [Citrus x changshan-huyou]|uniref:Uncharacterized protein n=1 Tax=Citrus x changshan-huyou TaxID=2935761 RepID=A0AAP0QJR8_9ROSI